MNEFKDWDVKIGDQIDFFDPSLSYELTGYRPITETEGLDFDPSWFMEVVDYKNKKGVHCSSPPGSYAFRNFWLGEYDKCKNGYIVNGYRITGQHYFFLNFYKLLNANNVGKAGSGREYSNPNFWAKHYEYFHYLEMCELLEKDACALKSRGVGFSEIGASIGACTYSVIQNSKTMYIASAENYLLKNGVLQKVWDCLETLNQETEGGLRHLTQKKKEPMWRRASVLDKQGQESGWMSEIFGQVVDNPRKLRGVRLEYLLFEECFGKGTKVVMSDFSIKNIEDIIIGDFVLGIDGKPKEVMRTCTGIDDLYLVKQKKGFDYIVNSKHKLYFESRPRVGNMPDEIKLMTAKEYNNLSSYYKRTTYGLRNNAIKYSQDKINIDPYLLGLWLGDGISASTTICVNESKDPEISSFLSEFSKSNGFYIRKSPSTTYKTGKTKDSVVNYHIRNNEICKNELSKLFRKYNLLNNKHIPKEVFESTLNYRLKVLAGLIDTDGNIKRGSNSYSFNYEISMARKELIDEIELLARTCGFSVKKKKRIMKNGYKKNSIAYRLSIKGNVRNIPVKVERKKIPNDYLETSNKLSTGIDSIDCIGKGEYFGITLKSYGDEQTDNLFLLEDFTIVHNCGSFNGLVTVYNQAEALVNLLGKKIGTRILWGKN